MNNGFITIDELTDGNGTIQQQCGMTGAEITFLDERDGVICNDCIVNDDDAHDNAAGGFFLYETDDSQGIECDYCNAAIYGIYDEIDESEVL